MTPDKDPLLYHYTSVESFQRIIDSGKFWASHIRYLNDTSEQRLVENVFRAATGHQLEKVMKAALDRDIYVISFSQDGGDRLSQWRGYGGGAGVALDFTQEALDSASPHGRGVVSNVTPVSYANPAGDEDIDWLFERRPLNSTDSGRKLHDIQPEFP